MKPVPLLLLLASLLLVSHIRPGVCRPRRNLPGPRDGGGRPRSRPDEALLRAAGDAASYLLRGGSALRAPRAASPADAATLAAFPLRGELAEAHLAHLARAWAAVEEAEEAEEAAEAAEEAAEEVEEEEAGLGKRNAEPPISIDLTFHLLRNMIEMAKIENQKEQAELNRKFLEEVGK